MPTPGTTKARGYDARHRAERRRWKPDVDAGLVDCHATRCLEEEDGNGRRLIPGKPWDLGHTTDRTDWTGPEHRRCNRADGGRRRHKPAGPKRWVL